MASNIQIIRNFPRTELKRDGWAKSKLASAMQPATYTPAYDDAEGTHAASYKSSALPAELWREPNTGIILLKPSVLDSNFWEDPNKWLEDTLPSSYWHLPSPAAGVSGFLATSYNNGMVTVRPDNTTSTYFDLVMIPLAIKAILAQMRSTMSWVMQTKDSLAINEGWSVIVHPPGIYTERATDYMLINFGDKYCLHLRMDGTASLWSMIRTNTNGVEGALWIERTTFKYSGGGVEHGKPFQITIVPWGFSYISLVFSQSSEPSRKAKNTIRTDTGTTFLYDIAKEEGINPKYDVPTKQYVKTKSAPLRVAIRSIYFQYGFVFSRVRYKTGGQLYLMPEKLPEVKPQADPTFTWAGFQGMITPSGQSPDIIHAYTNELGNPYQKAIDTQFVSHFTMTPSYDGLYTPELWSLDIDIPADTHTPNWTSYEQSNWVYLRFQQSVEPSPSVASFKIIRDSFTELMRGWGPVRLKVEGQTVFDGYIQEKLPTIATVVDKGVGNPRSKAIVQTQYNAHDLWVKLDEKLVYNFVFLNGLSLLEVLRSLIKRAGFTDSDIIVNDEGSYLAGLVFQGFIDPNDQAAVAQFSTCGDMLRGVLKFYGILPIRIRPIDGKWYIYLAPQYTTTPTYLFKTKSPKTTDAVRRASNEYLVYSDLEFKIEEPAFNALLATVSDSTGEGAVGMESIVPANVVDNDTVTNPDAFWFIGRVKLRRVFPPEIPFIQSQEELNKVARVFWNRESKHKPVVEFNGDWRPGGPTPDSFIWLQGVDETGANVSYGAWRVISVDVEGQYDFPGKDMRWSWKANYVCTYEGTASSTDYPMFSSILP